MLKYQYMNNGEPTLGGGVVDPGGAQSPVFPTQPAPHSTGDIILGGNDQPKKTQKTVLFIALAAIAIIIIIIVAILVLMPQFSSNNSTRAQQSASSIASIFTYEDIQNVENLESEYNYIKSGTASSEYLLSEDFQTIFQSGIDSYHKIFNSLSQNLGGISDTELQSQLSELYPKMQTNLQFYDTSYQNYQILLDAINSENIASLSQIEDDGIREVAESFYNTYIDYQANLATKDELDCDATVVVLDIDAEDPEIVGPYTECDIVYDNIHNLYTELSEIPLGYDLLFGSNEDTIVNNFLGPDMRKILVNSEITELPNEN